MVRRDALPWLAVATASAAGFVAWTQPVFRLGITAIIGAGDTERSFRYDRNLTPLADLRPWSLVVAGAALLMIALSVAALRGWGRTAPTLLACVLSVLALGGVVDTEDRLGWVEGGGVQGYDHPRAGPLLTPALRDLQRRARRSHEARDPRWELLEANGYRSRGLGAWEAVSWLAITLALLTTYLTFRLRLRRPSAIGATAFGAVALLAWWVARGISHLG